MKLNRWVDWSQVLLSVTAAVLTYCSVMMIIALVHLTVGLQLYLHWIHKAIVLILVLSILMVILSVGVKWKHGWSTILISFQVTGPFLHIGAVVAVTALAWVVIGFVFQATKVLRIFSCVLYLGVVISLYLIPLAISSPCIIEKEALGPRPAMMGHRGAPMLAPENTLMSFQETVTCGAKVFESDVQISYDGVPFLMHDTTLRRTTNVVAVFPERAGDNASMFTWAELQQLNAGEWFLQKDPFNTVQSLTLEAQRRAANQSICSLAQLLELAKTENRAVMFDLQSPETASHPFLNITLNIILDTILNSSIPHHLILWLSDSKDSVPYDFQQVLKDTPAPETQDGNRTLINLQYSNISYTQIRQYTERNITVNLFVVNEPWLFSVLWCANVLSVTTDACHIFQEMSQPVWRMDPDIYLKVLVCTDVTSFLLILGMFFIHRWRYGMRHTATLTRQTEMMDTLM
ncbi:glycerophosphodiester phosphodiesterase domain-containing protein 5 [Callorhinchus milii]|nr:glycerophosphodiester phosphodiesterase domain-containing protein 5 [Callorhinchus milii]